MFFSSELKRWSFLKNHVFVSFQLEYEQVFYFENIHTHCYTLLMQTEKKQKRSGFSLKHLIINSNFFGKANISSVQSKSSKQFFFDIKYMDLSKICHFRMFVLGLWQLFNLAVLKF